ncbi:MAG TPA: VWA domain-containing protein, partial [Dehalococcoidia bacterium]|nr:VWA domain-containing protein [Dehalococcoidia bacterium]
EVLVRVRSDALGSWYEHGARVLERSVDGGEAFFRLESSQGEEVLDNLSSRVELARVSEVLRLYCKALTGTDIALAAASGLTDKHIGWMSNDLPSTEGTSIFLPEAIEESDNKGENFQIYKVYATHQAGHLEFGSFWFRFGRPGAILGDAGRRRLAEAVPSHRQALTDIEAFFDLFPDRQLAADLFAIVEDARIDAIVMREYGGIRRSFRAVQQSELARRPLPERMPLRQAFAEALVRLSLDEHAELRWPAQLQHVLWEAAEYLNCVRISGARVEDAAEATIALYDLLKSVPNLSPEDLGFDADDWQDFQAPETSMDPSEMQEGGVGEGGEAAQFAMSPDGEGDMPYESPEQVGFRGDFKPELVQLLMRLRQGGEQADGEMSQAPISPEMLQQLLEKSVEITLTDVAEGDLASSSGMFADNLMKEAEALQKEQERKKQKGGSEAGQGGPDENDQPLASEPKFFLYDEWDFRAGDYKPRWCRLMEQTLDEGDIDFYERTTREKATLIAQTRRQFELLRPELFRKIKRLHDGEEFDLDAAIEYIAERRSGHSPNDKVYWRRNKVERDVAVAFLLDMSASTDEEIEKRKPVYDEDEFDDDPRRYLSWWASRRAHEMLAPAKRIIDVEKESIVLLIKALETIGDAYGIYGFSGYGRENVEYYVIKDLQETFGERIKRRIDRITPIRSTRMGPAIRHTTTKLLAGDAKVKILFLVSDGRPQDHGYGRDRTEKEYAIHDTKMALTEAKRKGVTPFALTVDRNGHDYLKQMCDDMGYEVLADVEALPGRLPALYRMLTE